MDKRRSAAAALEVNSNIAEFISTGVPSDKPNGKDSNTTGAVEKPTQVEVNEPIAAKVTKSKPVIAKKKRGSQSETPQSITYSQTIAQARIQKSIRFLPTLIARFEDFVHRERQAGRKPPTLQDAQNEAMDMWLRRQEK
ncbi:MAG: hypothetical protein AB8G99_12210 [Planctomycetaceae bacterium]